MVDVREFSTLINVFAKYEKATGWQTQYGFFDVDWWDLNLLLDKPPAALPLTRLPADIKIENPEKGNRLFSYRIRSRFVSSRPLTKAEARSMKD